MEAVNIVISGQVQKVGFRYFCLKEAIKLNLVGWVKNKPNGSVEVVAEGNKENLERLINWCYQGSPSAQVTRVDFNWLPAGGKFTDFDILP